MKHVLFWLGLIGCCWCASPCGAQDVPVSDATQECIECHSTFHPGIVSDWQASRHAATTPEAALQASGLQRKVSNGEIPADLQGFSVGCAECHTRNSEKHLDSFEHNGYQVHAAVSPRDCGICHSEEVSQYGRNPMSYAEKNLSENELYKKLRSAIVGPTEIRGGRVVDRMPGALADGVTCFYCHGTRLELDGTETRDTEIGELEFPRIKGWPNQGVGRVNLDGSRGSCSACHSRHRFSIESARKPQTCSECHVGPDVPAYKVYMASKHGLRFAQEKQNWNFENVPWTVGQDFQTPTCAACHMSLLVDPDGEIVVERTHEITNRISWRIFGLVYAHPQPLLPDFTVIRNKDGLPLPTDFNGGTAKDFLIDPDEMQSRRETMQGVCRTCHGSSWVRGHWQRYDDSIRLTNDAVYAATQLLMDGWKRGLASPDNPFDEAFEKTWQDAWLFYANSVRFSAAMAGGGDYAVFADGWYRLKDRIREMEETLNRFTDKPPPASNVRPDPKTVP